MGNEQDFQLRSGVLDCDHASKCAGGLYNIQVMTRAHAKTGSGKRVVVYNPSMFTDQIEIHAKSCKCGDGMIHFRSEKFVLQGGPDGGDVIVEVKSTPGEFELEGQD